MVEALVVISKNMTERSQLKAGRNVISEPFR